MKILRAGLSNSLKFYIAYSSSLNQSRNKQIPVWVPRLWQGLIQAVFDIGVPILRTLIFVCPNSILNEIITTSKHNSSFLIISVT